MKQLKNDNVKVPRKPKHVLFRKKRTIQVMTDGWDAWF